MMKRRLREMGVILFVFAAVGLLRTRAEAAEVTDLKQTACTENSAAVEWAAVEGADHYVCSLSDGLSETVTEEITDTTYTFSDLFAGTSYQMIVSAYQGEEQIAVSPASYEIVTSPDVTAFTVSQANAGKSFVTISMSGAVGANYYIVTTTGTDGEQVAVSTKEKVKVKELKANKRYKYKVYAVRKSEGDFYAYTDTSYKKITAKTISDAVPAQKFDIKDMDFANDKYTFGLKGTYKGDGYELQLRTMAGKEKKLVLSTGMDDIVIEDFIKGHFYKYRVRTFVACQTKNVYSKWSEDKYIGVAEDAFGVISLNSIRITWQKVTDVKSYEVSVSTTGKDADYRLIKTVSASAKRKVVLTRVFGSRIRLNKKYYFRIRPVAMDGNKEIKSEYTNDVVVILK